jgi:hypothetical protein
LKPGVPIKTEELGCRLEVAGGQRPTPGRDRGMSHAKVHLYAIARPAETGKDCLADRDRLVCPSG